MTTTVSLAATVMLQVFRTCTDPKLLLIPTIFQKVLHDRSLDLSNRERTARVRSIRSTQRNAPHSLTPLGIEHRFDDDLQTHEGCRHREDSRCQPRGQGLEIAGSRALAV